MTIRRSTWFDWYEDGDESAVLLGDTVVVLSQLATVLVDAVGEGTTIEALAGLLGEAFGAPDDGDVVAATRAAVGALVESGVLTSEGAG